MFEYTLKSTRFDASARTFVEGMNVTRLLGIRYLWIYSLRIIRESEVDWGNRGEQDEQCLPECHPYITCGYRPRCTCRVVWKHNSSTQAPASSADGNFQSWLPTRRHA